MQPLGQKRSDGGRPHAARATLPAMRSAFRFAIIPGALGLLAACTSFKAADTLRPQAAYDLRCDQKQLELTVLSGNCEGTKLGNRYDCTYGVRCGDQQVTYSHIPDSDTWVMNSSRVPQ